MLMPTMVLMRTLFQTPRASRACAHPTDWPSRPWPAGVSSLPPCRRAPWEPPWSACCALWRTTARCMGCVLYVCVWRGGGGGGVYVFMCVCLCVYGGFMCVCLCVYVWVCICVRASGCVCVCVWVCIVYAYLSIYFVFHVAARLCTTGIQGNMLTGRGINPTKDKTRMYFVYHVITLVCTHWMNSLFFWHMFLLVLCNELVLYDWLPCFCVSAGLGRCVKCWGIKHVPY